MTNMKRELCTIIGVLLLLIILFAPMVFQHMRPGGVDVIGSMGNSHQIQEYEKATGEIALWNPYVFSGMPLYHRIHAQAYSFDTFVGKVLGKIFYSILWYYLLGFVGMYLLMRRLGVGYFPALFCGLGFMLIPHYMSLLSIGHFAKFRPIMYLPLVTFFFVSFMERKNILWLIGFIFAFVLQIRTQHYQIVFYQILILFFVGIYHMIVLFKKKQAVTGIKKIILLIPASILIIMMVAQPLFVTHEYTPHSIRGGTGQQGSTGLDTEYATRWSFQPLAMLNWVMPRFLGGRSGEPYTGSSIPQLSGRTVPGYWGDMPFTQTYDYIGCILVFFALIGLILNRRRGIIIATGLLFLLSLFLSFGRHFPVLYNIFFTFVPYFNKFRVPSMIMVVMQFCIVLWAGFGLQSVLGRSHEKHVLHAVFLSAGILIFISIIPLLFGGSFSCIKSGEAQQYEPQMLNAFQQIRLEMMHTDAIRLLLFTLLISTITFFYTKKHIKLVLFLLLTFLLLGIDQIPYVKKAEGELVNTQELEKQHFAQKPADLALLQDTGYYRVFPITENPFNTNDWSYYHHSIGGYNAAKLRIYQDIIEECLYKGPDPILPLNWNVMKMLNTRYIVSTSQLPGSQIAPYYFDQYNKFLIYKCTNHPQPAWFVDDVNVITDRDERFRMMNTQRFDSYHTALLESPLPASITAAPDSVRIAVTPSVNSVSYDVYNSAPGLFVTSEIYYPHGWICLIDGKESPIYKTNHILRSVYIDQPGNHTVTFTFSPKTFKHFYGISLIGHCIAWISCILAGIMTWRAKRKDWVQHNE